MDVQLACRLIKASHLAYAISADGTALQPSADGQREIEAIGLDPITIRVRQSPESAGIDAFIYGRTARDETILAFRGTLAPSLMPGDAFLRILSDWLNDGEVDLVGGAGLAGRVHRGFLRSLDHLWPAIDALRGEIREATGRGGQFFVTGHSKGGALAALAAFRLARLGTAPTAVYTFAAPRTGDRVFASAFDESIANAWRFEYRDDIVPHLPPSTAAWFSVFSALHAITRMFPAEAPRPEAEPQTASEFDHLTGRVAALVAQRSPAYAPVGTLQFIDWEDRLQGDSRDLTVERNLRLARLLAEFRLREVIEDHFSTGGYMTWPCGNAPAGGSG
jgi:triacylglycerol lipase